MKTLFIFVLACASVFGAETDILVFSIARTNAENASVSVKDIFTRDGQTNLIRVTKIVAGKVSRTYRFYHGGQNVGNYLAFPEGDAYKAVFNTEAGPYCMSLKFGASGEVLSARIGDKGGLLLDEFGCTNGVFSPLDGSLRQVGLMKPKFGSESDFMKQQKH
jgi:hypothetical protein